jgi:glutathione peroxidase
VARDTCTRIGAEVACRQPARGWRPRRGGSGGSRVAAVQTGGAATFYDLNVRALNGTPGNLAQYKGTVTLVVNVASQCAYTPQYEGLEKLHREMKSKGLTVLGFPSNDFGEQEPGSAEEIARFCKLNYDVTFPLFEKLVTKRGPDQSPVYSYLGQYGRLPAWNFSKYVVDRQGKVVAFFPSEVTPDDPALHKAITAALAR